MNEREKLLRSIARTERKLARMRARLEDEMRTAEQIKKDIEASEKALHSSRLDVARWQKLEEQLRAELAALPAEPVRLRAVDGPWKQESPARLATNEAWINFAGGSGFHGERVWRMRRVGKYAAGRVLDGVIHDGLPEAFTAKGASV